MATTNQYDEDFFADTRMTFGEHLEELKTRMWAALKGLGLCLVIGFFLDGAGDALGLKWLGVGKPALQFITAPIESEVKDFYARRYAAKQKQLEELEGASVGSTATYVEIPAQVPVQPLLDTFEGLKLKDESLTHIPVIVRLDSKRL